MKNRMLIITTAAVLLTGVAVWSLSGCEGGRGEAAAVAALAVLIAAAAAVVSYFRTSVSPRIERVKSAIEGTARGDFDRSLEIYGNDELGAIEKTLNGTIEALKDRIAEERIAREKETAARIEAAIRESEERTADLQRRLDDWKKEDEMKTELSMVIFHDLRSPLAALQSCIYVVLEGIVGEINPKQKDMLQRADSDIDKLLSLISDLLTLSISQKETDKASLDVKPIQLADTLRRIVASSTTRAEQKGVEVTTDIPAELPVIQADRNQIEHIFSNLVGNAVRYTKNGGIIAVRAAGEAGAIEVSVSDTGIGIPEEDLPKIFDIFFRSENAKAMEKVGTGLGLAIVSRMVKAHGGAIDVSSRLGEGSTFTVRLPVKTDAAAQQDVDRAD